MSHVSVWNSHNLTSVSRKKLPLINLIHSDIRGNQEVRSYFSHMCHMRMGVGGFKSPCVSAEVSGSIMKRLSVFSDMVLRESQHLSLLRGSSEATVRGRNTDFSGKLRLFWQWICLPFAFTVNCLHYKMSQNSEKPHLLSHKQQNSCREFYVNQLFE